MKGCMCTAALWWGFGQLQCCREHPGWDGNILSSPGNSFFLLLHSTEWVLSTTNIILFCINTLFLTGWLSRLLWWTWIYWQGLYITAFTWKVAACENINSYIDSFFSALVIWLMLRLIIDWNWHWRLQVLLASCPSSWACWWEPKECSICKFPLLFLFQWTLWNTT
jgi:hypothetical protein